jgi:FdhE protein
MTRYPEVGEILDFYGRVLERQLVIAAEGGVGGGPVAGIDWRAHVGVLRSFLDLCSEAPAAEVARGADRLRGADDGGLAGLVEAFLREKQATPVERFILTGFLGGALALPASIAPYDRREWLQRVCPVCGFPPVVSYVADIDEVEGARFARCGLCHADWYFGRASCLACGNSNDHELHYYRPEGVPSVVTVQACSACGRYVKVVDTRGVQQGTPELDDVATMTFDLWVREKGYHKISPNLFGF